MKLKPVSDFLMLPNKVIEQLIKNDKVNFSTLTIFLILYYLHDRFSKTKFFYTDKQMQENFGISSSSMQRARVVMKKIGLIDYRSGFRTKRQAKATRYKIIPDKEIRKRWKLTIQKD